MTNDRNRRTVPHTIGNCYSTNDRIEWGNSIDVPKSELNYGFTDSSLFYGVQFALNHP
jgi:hypothetical protein